MRNKFKTASIISLIISVLIIFALIDYQNYLKHPEYSAPFWVYQAPEITAYGIPAILGLLLSVMFNRKAINFERY
jgi:heme/copper-type cytochrome/quinol oxidase subunit 2